MVGVIGDDRMGLLGTERDVDGGGKLTRGGRSNPLPNDRECLLQ